MNPTVIRPSTKLEYAVLSFSGLLILAAVVTAHYHGPAWYAALIVAVILALKAVRSLLAKRFVTMTISGSSLCLESGILSKSTRTLDLLKVQDVRSDQSLLQRMFDIGDLTLETAGESGRLAVASIDSPRRVADQILELAHRRTGEFSSGRGASAEP